MNPEMRKYMRKAKTIAKSAELGETVMCPCGCMTNFKKETKYQCFNTSNGTKCKDRYYNITRKKNNPALKMSTHKKIKRMGLYIAKKEKEVIQKYLESKENKVNEVVEKGIELKLSVSDNFDKNEFIELMKQTKNISQISPINKEIMCPCGCGTSFIKSTKANAYNRIEGNKHKDDYYGKIRGEIEIEYSIENKNIFNNMKKYVLLRAKILKDELEEEKDEISNKKRFKHKLLINPR